MIYLIPYASKGVEVEIVNDEGVELILEFTSIANGEAKKLVTNKSVAAGCKRSFYIDKNNKGFDSYLSIVASHACPITARTMLFAGDMQMVPIYAGKTDGEITLEDLLMNPFNQKWMRRKSSFVISDINKESELILTNFEDKMVYAHIDEKSDDGEAVQPIAVIALNPFSVSKHQCQSFGYAKVVIKDTPIAFKADPILALVTVLGMQDTSQGWIEESN